jgi:hypothetical protein
MKQILRPTSPKIRITLILVGLTFIGYILSPWLFNISCSSDSYPYTNLGKVIAPEGSSESFNQWRNEVLIPFAISTCPLPPGLASSEIYLVKVGIFIFIIMIFYILTCIFVEFYGTKKTKIQKIGKSKS